MLIDKHEADNIFNRIPGLIIKMSPELAAIDQVLDDDELFNMIRNDLAQRHHRTLTVGRKFFLYTQVYPKRIPANGTSVI
jgi:hypothetical protein